jgi:hypothetical protein
MRDGRTKKLQPAGLRIRWTKKEQFVVENLFVFECAGAEDALELFGQGLQNKVIASHNLNHQSSRSHCIFTLSVETIDPNQLDTVVTSKLQLVDLAGSEKIQATTQTMAKESIDINKSLFVLRKVITRLSELATGGNQKDAQQQHVPYRDSKLTSLLKHSLGGNSFCLMIACISPSERFLAESLSTLNYATRAASIKNQPTKNVDPKTQLIEALQGKVEALQRELRQANDHIECLTLQIGERDAAIARGAGANDVGSPQKNLLVLQKSVDISDKSVRFHPGFKEQMSKANDRLLDTVAKVTELLRAN